MTDASGLAGLFVAALGGAAVGVERQRSGHASGTQARFGGVRTFTLLGGLAGLAGWLITRQLVAPALVLIAGAVALVVAGYVAASRTDVDATTETAGLVVIAAGVLAGLGWLALASGIVAISTLLLVEKSALHSLVGRIEDQELHAAARFGVMAVVILPLLPEGPLAQLGGIKPRELWLLVLFFTGISFVGYLARRLFGANRGYPLAGLLGGMISSTNVTFAFARLSRREHALSPMLAVGTIGACAMLFPRVFVASAVIAPTVARALVPYLTVPFAIGIAALAIWWRKNRPHPSAPEMPPNPLQMGPALQMAATFQVVFFVAEFARRLFGTSGLLASAAILGLTDVDALTISMARMPPALVTPDVAARAIALGVLVNCALKTVVAIALGTPRFRRVVAATLTAMAIAIAVSIGALR